MARTRNAYRTSRSVYVDGNTVRKVMPERQSNTRPKSDALSVRERQRILSDRAMESRARAERLEKKTQAISMPYLFALLLASVATLYLCFTYIQLQTDLNTRISTIDQKKSELDALRSENDALKNSIDTSIDLDEIYQVATQELGMVYPSEDQVITYDKSESEYVRQYDSIPQY